MKCLGLFLICLGYVRSATINRVKIKGIDGFNGSSPVTNWTVDTAKSFIVMAGLGYYQTNSVTGVA